MQTIRKLHPHTPRFAAMIVIIVVYFTARLPQISGDERAHISARFHFERQMLPALSVSNRKSRAVHPALKHIAAWISTVGASVALNDLDADGLPNDVCYIDVRSDQVIVAPVPGTGNRYKPFLLDPRPALPYDPATMAPMGVLPGDFNADGRMDILVYYWGRSPVLFLSRQSSPPGTVVRLTAAQYEPHELITPMQSWYTNAATQADIDGDGHLDLIFGNYFPDDSQVLNAHPKEGDPIPQMQASMSRADNGGGMRFLLWKGVRAGAPPTVRYKEVNPGLPANVVHGWTLAIGAADLDGDLLPEIYFANDFGPDRLLHNRSTPGHLVFALLEGKKTFTTPNSKVLGHDSFKGMGVDFGDINRDGLPDIFVSNIASNFALEESNFLFVCTGDPGRMKQGVAPYEDRSESLGLSRSGWGWDCKLADFDNDSNPEALQALGFIRGTVNRWPELHELAMGNDQMLHNPSCWPQFQAGEGDSQPDDLCGHQNLAFFVLASNGRYYNLSADVGLVDSQVTRGIAIADVDGDGRLDFATANQWDPSYFYHNESRHVGAFLGLHLRLPCDSGITRTRVRAGHPGPDTQGYPAIGASARVLLPDGSPLIAQVDGGNGHSGKRSPDLHFGLGDLPANTRLPVELKWRDTSGNTHLKKIGLTAGWHTVLLGRD
jgi:hypothetical protein